jgi:hypothetical protein
MKRIQYFFLILIVCIMSQCQSKTDNTSAESDDTWEVEKYKITKGGKLNPKDWKCNDAGEENICIPSAWKPLKQDVMHYFAYLNNNNDNTYFTVAKYNMMTQDIDASKYLSEVYSQLLKDTTENFEGYTLKKLIFIDKEAYYGEYYTNINKIPYFTYSMLVNHNGVLYEIALKVERNKDPNYKETFQNILYNFRVDGSQIFSEKDEIEKVQIIDLSAI